MPEPVKKILAVRFSALGDAAMCLPVLESLCKAHPEIEVHFLSRDSWQGLYAFAHPHIRFTGRDLNRYKGIPGLYRLYRELKKENFDAVADLHDVLRTKFLRFFFRLGGTPCSHIRKGRKEKKALCHPRHKRFGPLKSTFERYREVFRNLGLDFDWDFVSVFDHGLPDGNKPGHSPVKPDENRLRQALQTGFPAEETRIGIAPFAKHPGKVYPSEKMETVIARLSQRPHTRIFLFGGGKAETECLEKWAERYPGTVCCAGKIRMTDELQLMRLLDVLVSMDSANMHLASLAGTPVVSVWGATHPYAGFLGWNQSPENAVQKHLPCRPCSVFGNKPCRFGNYACMREIAPEEILAGIETVLRKKNT